MRHPVLRECSGKVSAWNQPEETHPLLGSVETGNSTRFGQNGDGTQPIEAAQADKGLHHRCEGPSRGLVNRVIPIDHTLASLNIVLEDDWLHRIRKRRVCAPVLCAGVGQLWPGSNIHFSSGRESGISHDRLGGGSHSASESPCFSLFNVCKKTLNSILKR